jgi:hypothetical protein
MNFGPHGYPCGDSRPFGKLRAGSRLAALSYEGSSRAKLDRLLSSSMKFDSRETLAP